MALRLNPETFLLGQKRNALIERNIHFFPHKETNTVLGLRVHKRRTDYKVIIKSSGVSHLISEDRFSDFFADTCIRLLLFASVLNKNKNSALS